MQVSSVSDMESKREHHGSLQQLADDGDQYAQRWQSVTRCEQQVLTDTNGSAVSGCDRLWSSDLDEKLRSESAQLAVPTSRPIAHLPLNVFSPPGFGYSFLHALTQN